MSQGITQQFIEYWQIKYDHIENDEPEYQKLQKDIMSVHLGDKLSKDVFIRVFNWKARRAKGFIDWKNFSIYQDTFSALMNATDNKKMLLLTQPKLKGIGVPMASVFLNLIWPEKYPIIDRRTVEVLRKFGYIKWKTITQTQYWKFAKVILNIQKNCSNISLRKIDRSLFSYHKIKLSEQKTSEVSCDPHI